jgi:hypothetical protein
VNCPGFLFVTVKTIFPQLSGFLLECVSRQAAMNYLMGGASAVAFYRLAVHEITDHNWGWRFTLDADLPPRRPTRLLSNMAMLSVLKDMNESGEPRWVDPGADAGSLHMDQALNKKGTKSN